MSFSSVESKNCFVNVRLDSHKIASLVCTSANGIVQSSEILSYFSFIAVQRHRLNIYFIRFKCNS